MLNKLLDQILNISLEKSRVLVPYIIRLGIIGIILPFYLLCYYSHPCQDDFTNGYHARSTSFISFFTDIYNNLTGAYSGITAMALFNPLGYGWLGGVKLYMALSLTVFLIAFYFLLNTVSSGAFQKKYILWASLFLGAYFFATMPEVFGTFYWMESNIGYFIGIIFLMLFFAFYLKYCFAEGRNKKRWYLAGAVITGFLTVGFYEFFMIIMTLFVFMHICRPLFFSDGKKAVLHDYFLFFAVVAGDIIFLSGPGNYHRMNQYTPVLEHQFDAIHTITRSFYNTLMFLSNSFIRSPLPLLTFMIIPVGYRLISESRTRILTSIHPLIPLIFSLFFVFISNAFFIFATGGSNLAGRSQGAIYFMFLLGWFYTILATINYYRNKNITVALPGYVKYMAVPCLVLMLFSGNVKNAYIDFFKYAPIYDMELNNRYVLLERMKNSPEKQITVPTVSLVPKSFSFGGDLESSHIYTLDSMQIRLALNYFGIRNKHIIIEDRVKRTPLFH